MKLAAQLDIAAKWCPPPVYQIRWFTNAAKRLLILLTPFTLRRVTSDILLIRLTQIIRELTIHRPASRQQHNFLL